jgi:hypothetical protein
MYCRANKCKRDQRINRIEYEYTNPIWAGLRTPEGSPLHTRSKPKRHLWDHRNRLPPMR